MKKVLRSVVIFGPVLHVASLEPTTGQAMTNTPPLKKLPRAYILKHSPSILKTPDKNQKYLQVFSHSQTENQYNTETSSQQLNNEEVVLEQNQDQENKGLDNTWSNNIENLQNYRLHEIDSQDLDKILSIINLLKHPKDSQNSSSKNPSNASNKEINEPEMADRQNYYASSNFVNSIGLTGDLDFLAEENVENLDDLGNQTKTGEVDFLDIPTKNDLVNVFTRDRIKTYQTNWTLEQILTKIYQKNFTCYQLPESDHQHINSWHRQQYHKFSLNLNLDLLMNWMRSQVNFLQIVNHLNDFKLYYKTQDNFRISKLSSESSPTLGDHLFDVQSDIENGRVVEKSQYWSLKVPYWKLNIDDFQRQTYNLIYEIKSLSSSYKPQGQIQLCFEL